MDTMDTISIGIKIKDEYFIDISKVCCSQPNPLQCGIQLYCHHTCIVGTQQNEKDFGITWF